MKKAFLGAAALALAIAAPAANAATYNFNWSADPANDPTIVSSDDATLTAVGTFDINVAFGSAFTNSDISNVSITVSGVNIVDFVSDLLNIVTGTISATGAVTYDDFLAQGQGINAIGCLSPGCSGSQLFIEDDVATKQLVEYTSPASALGALGSATSLAVAAVPIPAGGLLLLSGLAGVAGLKRRKKHAA